MDSGAEHRCAPGFDAAQSTEHRHGDGVGYSTPYKGKFHVTKPASRTGKWVPEDVNQYGFQRWNPPDAGANQDPSEFGGGDANNDGRFMHAHGSVKEGDEGVLDYLRSPAAKQGPFFLVVSLVNPHDVLAYPKTAFDNGYNPNGSKATSNFRRRWMKISPPSRARSGSF